VAQNVGATRQPFSVERGKIPKCRNVDTLIVSDVHLGSEVSRAPELLDMLRSHSFRRLILLGDIFSDLNFKRLKSQHWELLSYIRKLSNPKRRVEIVWVEGNHDKGLSDVMSHLVGIKVYQHYEWYFQGRRYLAIHGHQFDRFIVDNAIVSDLSSFIYLCIQKFDFGKQRFSRCLDRLNTSWLRMSPRVAAGALRFASEQSADVVFCGHTHEAQHLEGEGVNYYNTGCWTQSPSTFITIDDSGVRINSYE
jgi:UDP-2,3-diacylglucosamine pyrophosphatase LpxH